MPGGGYANLELYERLGSSPDVTVVAILGEGSFHQVHGGTTTNQPDADERHARLMSLRRALRASCASGRSAGPGKPIHFVGRISRARRCARGPRRMTAPRRSARRSDVDGERRSGAARCRCPRSSGRSSPTRSGAASRGRTDAGSASAVERAPTDLLAYQELIARGPARLDRRDRGDGAGAARFLASICDLVGHGRVLVGPARGLPSGEPHPRITLDHSDHPRRGRRASGSSRAVGEDRTRSS